MLDFASNFNPLGPPAGVDDFVECNLEGILRSYSSEQGTLNHAVAGYLGVSADCVATGNGSTEILFTMPSFLKHDRAVAFSPTFWQYSAANDLQGRTVETIELSASQGFSADLEALDEALASQGASVYIANPNNPTSTKISKDKLLSVVANNESSDFVVDETYLQFDEKFSKETLSGEATTIHNLHVVHSFSKFFATPGIRAGAVVSDSETIRRYLNQKIPYTASPLAEIALPWMLEQKDYIENSRRISTEERSNISGLCARYLGERALFRPPEANFMFVDLKLPVSKLGSHLLEKNIAVREGGEFGPMYSNYFRFVLRSAQENEFLLSNVEEFLDVQQ